MPVGFLGLLTVLFVGLKLTGYVTWSWWGVLAPVLIPTGVLLLLIIAISIVAIVDAVKKARKEK